jgi:hypothetical protein
LERTVLRCEVLPDWRGDRRQCQGVFGVAECGVRGGVVVGASGRTGSVQLDADHCIGPKRHCELMQ